MVDLTAAYLGMTLKNPLVVASSKISASLEGIENCTAAGAGAVVLKSLFEEQLLADTRDLAGDNLLHVHPEALEYVNAMGRELGVSAYLELISAARKKVDIPIIASLNCVSARGWIDFAPRLENAGASALELNLALISADPARSAEQIENDYLEILKEVKSRIKIPLALKIGCYFTSLARLAERLAWNGASALVLFNRFYQVDIDVEKRQLKSGPAMSVSRENLLPLRWISLLRGRVKLDLAASTGVHDGSDLIKMLLAGADAVQICSTLYLNGLDRIKTMLEQLRTWMAENGFQNIGQFKGALSQEKSADPAAYTRLQYIKALVGIE